MRNKIECAPRTIHYMELPFDSWASVATFIQYNRSIQPDQEFKDIKNGTILKSASAGDLKRNGFNSEYTLSGFSLKLDYVLKTLGGSRVFRLAGAVLLALTGASILADNHQSEASNIQPLDSDPDYTPLFPHGEMVIHAHDEHDEHDEHSHRFGPSPDLPQLNPAEFITLSGGGFTATRIHGDGAPTDLSYLMAGQGYNDQQLLDSAQLYARTLLSIEPFKSRQDSISISVLHTQNTPDLGVSLANMLGVDSIVNKLIDDANLALGSYQETRVLFNNPDLKAAAHADPVQPNIYSRAGFTEGRIRSSILRGSIAHEDGGHGVAGVGEAYYSTNNWGNDPNVYINCLTADQIPIRWKGIPGAPGAVFEGCGNTQTGAFRDAEDDWMRRINANSYGPVTLWQLNHRLDGAPAIYYPPTLLEPVDGITVNGLGANLRFTPSEMTRQFQMQLIPYNSDGPGVNLIIGDPNQVKAAEFKVAAPKMGEGPYIMLSDMTYTWRVRQTSAAKPVGENDPVWSDWTEGKFRTPATSSATLSLPRDGFSAASTPETPFVWTDSNLTNFYYEIQVSGDPGFNTNPDTATSFVWWNLIHGGMTNPPNSWRAPSLMPETTYVWRVRPRVQGNGTPVAWGPVWSFTTGSNPNSFVKSHEVPSPASSQ